MTDFLDLQPTFGKYRDGSGRTWRDVVKEDPEYVEWVVAEASSVSEDLRFALEEALEETSLRRVRVLMRYGPRTFFLWDNRLFVTCQCRSQAIPIEPLPPKGDPGCWVMFFCQDCEPKAPVPGFVEA